MHIIKNKAGVNAKHKNHTVPRGLLKRWLVDEGSGQGHWVLDCASGQILRHPGKEASFAIREFRYVPVRNSEDGVGYRDESLEDWFSTGENDLAAVTDKVLANKISDIKESAFGGFVQAVILLGFRSWYEYECVEKRLRLDHPELTDEQAGRVVVDCFKKVYGAKLQQFKNWDYLLLSGLSESLLVCDRPLFDMTVSATKEECLLIPLAPDLLLMGTAPDDRARKTLSLQVKKGAGALAEKANHMTVERAREFVVGNKEQLVALLPRFSAGEFKKRKDTDTWRASVRMPLS